MTGVDYFSPNAAAAAGVVLQNIPHYSSRSVAESVVAEVLLHSRQRHLAYMDELRGRSVEARKGINLLQRTVGVVGYGSIGSEVTALLKAIGMKTLVWNRTTRPGVDPVSLEDVFEQSDVVCLCLKTVHQGADANVGMIDADLLSHCQGAIVINLANEALVDAAAMSEALTKGSLTAYSVEDSPGQRSALGSHENVHFAPSNAWNSDESMQTLREVWVNNVLSMIEGRPQNVCSG